MSWIYKNVTLAIGMSEPPCVPVEPSQMDEPVNPFRVDSVAHLVWQHRHEGRPFPTQRDMPFSPLTEEGKAWSRSLLEWQRSLFNPHYADEVRRVAQAKDRVDAAYARTPAQDATARLYNWVREARESPRYVRANLDTTDPHELAAIAEDEARRARHVASQVEQFDGLLRAFEQGASRFADVVAKFNATFTVDPSSLAVLVQLVSPRGAKSPPLRTGTLRRSLPAPPPKQCRLHGGPASQCWRCSTHARH